MKRTIERITRTAMLTVAFMLCATSAWATTTVTTGGNVGDDVTVVNSSNNGGGYSWNATDFTLTIPEKTNLPLGALIKVTSIEMATLNDASQNDGTKYSRPTAITIGGSSATLNEETTYDSTLFGTADNAQKIAKYEFSSGTEPILTVGLPKVVDCTFASDVNGLRALPTNSYGDTDLVVAVPNYNAQYVPCIRITGTIVSTTVYTASPTTATANFSELEWTPSIDDVDISEATLVIDGSSLSTLTVDQTLSFGTLVVKNAASPLTLTQSGDNAISIKNLKVASGVQLKLSGSAPLSVSNGGVTGGSEIYVSSGTTLTLTNAGCPAKFNVYGTLETAGDYSTLLINADNRFQASSHLKITSGTASVASPDGGNNGISGHVTIASNAKLVPLKDDGLSYNKSGVVLDIYGTLAFYFGRRWTIGSAANHTINLYDGAAITQSGSKNNMDFNLSSGKINVLGDATISGAVNLRSHAVTFNVVESKTLTLSCAPINAGTIEKTGNGTLSCTVDPTAALTITGGKVVSTVFPSGAVSIGEDCTFTLKNVSWTSSPERFSGAGTLELFNDRAYVGNTQQHCTHTVTGVTFGGTLKFTATNNTTYGCGHVISNAGFLSSDTRPQLELDTLSSGSYSKLFFSKSYDKQTVNIRDLKGSGDLSAKASGGTAQNQTLDNKQTENTEFSGRLITDDSGSDAEHKTNLIVYGDGSGEVKTLTLSGANTSVGQLSVSSDARVLFSSTGSWAAGTVTVANGGYLEVNNPSAVASTLNLQSGGTIKIATYTTTETVGEEEVETLHTRTITAGTVTFPDSGEAAIDISAIPDLGENETATIITASTSLDSDISKLRLVGKPYSLQVNGNSLEVINDGGLKWDSANGWGTKDVTKYSDATITVSSASDTVTLTADMTLDTLTITGSGTVTLTSTSSETCTVAALSIGAGVTLNASSSLVLAEGCAITGDGVLNIPAGGVVTITSSSALDGIKYLTGEGTLVVGANIPSAALRTLLTKVNENDSSTHYWKGTLSFVGLTSNQDTNDFQFELFGTADSKIKLTDCAISYLKNNDATFDGCLILNDDESLNGALRIGNGYSSNSNDFGELAGNGNMVFTGGPLQLYRFHTASNYTGSISIAGSWDNNNKKYDGRRIVFGTSPATVDNSSKPASITVDAGVEAGLGEGATWDAAYGIYISGTIIVNGDATLMSNKTLDNESSNPINLRGDKHIVFYDGAKLLYKKLCTVTTIGDVTLAEGSTVAIAFADGVSPVDGTKLISWSAAPAGSFVFDGDTPAYKEVDGSYYVLTKDTTGLFVREAVAVALKGGVLTYHATVAEAIAAAGDDGLGSVVIIKSTTENIVYDKTKVTLSRLSTDITTGTIDPGPEYNAVPGTDQSLASYPYTYTNKATTYYWTDADQNDHNWSTVGNWAVGSSSGSVATRSPTSIDSVVFNDGANVTHSAAVTVAAIAVNGAVSVSGTSSLETAGAITGSGTLTIAAGGLASAASGITIAPKVVFCNGTYVGCGTGGGGMTFNGDVTFSGAFAAWNATHTINGSVTINSGASFSSGNNYVNIEGDATVKGAFTAGSSKLKFFNGLTIEGGTVTADGSSINVDSDSVSIVLAGATAKFTDSRGEKITDNKVSTTVTGARVIKVDNATYKVGYGTIFSVW